MRALLAIPALVATLWSGTFAWKTQSEMPRLVDAGGHRLRMLVTGTRGPVVVFECAGEAPLEWWSRAQPDVSQFARCVTYDHAGYRASEPGPKPRDARQIARELHTALHNAGLPPPYLLVGHSFGGPYIRVFAGLYPAETAGLVLVDPSQEEFFEWLRERYPKINRISPRDSAEQNEWGCSFLSLSQAREAVLPEVPITLISATKQTTPLAGKLVPKFLQSHQNWLKTFPQARHIITDRSTHAVPYDEPQVIVEAIREIMALEFGKRSLPGATTPPDDLAR